MREEGKQIKKRNRVKQFKTETETERLRQRQRDAETENHVNTRLKWQGYIAKALD